MKRGTRLDGIRTVEDLRLRSVVDDDTGCWHWKLWCWKNGMPGCSIPVAGRFQKVSGRRAALILAGHELGPKDMAYATDNCHSTDCVNPRHCRIGTMRDVMRMHASRGLFSDPKHYGALVRHAKANARFTPEDRLEIVLSTDTAEEVGKRFGLSERMVNKMRRGKRTTPVSSVFEWRP